MTSFSLVLSLALAVLAFRLALELKQSGLLPMDPSAIHMITNSPQHIDSSIAYRPVKANLIP